jgi:hypothetical protein
MSSSPMSNRPVFTSRFGQGMPIPEGYPPSLITINQFILALGISSGPVDPWHGFQLLCARMPVARQGPLCL